jgi:hypothetical protein
VAAAVAVDMDLTSTLKQEEYCQYGHRFLAQQQALLVAAVVGIMLTIVVKVVLEVGRVALIVYLVNVLVQD